MEERHSPCRGLLRKTVRRSSSPRHEEAGRPESKDAYRSKGAEANWPGTTQERVTRVKDVAGVSGAWPGTLAGQASRRGACVGMLKLKPAVITAASVTR